MKRLLLILSLMFAACVAKAALPENLVTIRSSSEQFSITGFRPGPPSPALASVNSYTNLVRLNAAELAFTCENIKRIVLHELGVQDRWKGRIQVVQHANMNPNDEIVVASILFSDGWGYQVHLPDLVEREKLVRAIVQALLQEIANRFSPERSLELPLWLKEGMTMGVVQAGGPDLISRAQPMERVISQQFWVVDSSTRTQLKTSPLSQARVWLQAHPAVSFSDLSIPVDAMDAATWKNYQVSAQVFVAELLKLEGGRACMQAMFGKLPDYLNPQLAFLEAFGGHFKSALGVEKWWSVALSNFIARDDHAKWPGATSLERLDDILRAAVEVRTVTNALPANQEMNLQTLIQQVDFAHQRTVLKNAIAQLQVLEWSVPPDMLRLIYDYHKTLLNYLQKREQAANGGNSRDAASVTFKPLVRETVAQLDLLDVLRQDFKKYGLKTPENAQTP